MYRYSKAIHYYFIGGYLLFIALKNATMITCRLRNLENTKSSERIFDYLGTFIGFESFLNIKGM